MSNSNLNFFDLKPQQGSFRDEVLRSLSQKNKWVDPKFLYDETGSELFTKITKVTEYYQTRKEVEILEENVDCIMDLIGENVLLVEFGSGNSEKTRIILDELSPTSAYMPIDISKDYLFNTAKNLADSYGQIDIYPVCADYYKLNELPEISGEYKRKVIFFPGSTIGNMEPNAALKLLRSSLQMVGPDGGMIIGVDLKKDPRLLERAYNDSAQITSQFELNLLARMNRELDANFDLKQFYYDGIYNSFLGRVEMRVVSKKRQDVTVAGRKFHFEPGESIYTESSYKYTTEEFQSIGYEAGFKNHCAWTDRDRLFSVHYFSAALAQTNFVAFPRLASRGLA